MVSSTRRPIPLQGRSDLRTERIDYQGIGSYVIKDPVGLKYHRLQPEQFAILQLLDGRRSLEQIRDELQKQFPTLSFHLVDVQHLITDLHQKGLAQSNRVGQGASLIKEHRKRRRKKRLNAARNLLYLRLPGWDPERTLQWLYPLFSWIFRPWAVTLQLMLIAASMLLLLVQFGQLQERLPEFQQFFGWPNLLYLWLTLGITKVIHEFGHGLSCKHYSGECHEMGIMLLVFSPCLYCDVTDSWMLKNKWQRIMIGAAGMWIEIVISSIAVFVWWYTQPGLLHHLSLNVFFVTAVTTVIFNANPLMRFDGYYMLSDLLEIPNLRPKADKHMRERFAWYCLGIESRPDPFMPETGRGWFIFYAVSAAAYRWIILFGILLFLYTVLKPYGLQSIGITLAIVSVGSVIVNLFVNVYQIIAAPRIDPLSYPKVTATLAVLSLLIGCGLMVPLPLHIESMFLIEPTDVQLVYTTKPGRLTEVSVHAGDRVVADQPLAKLTNTEKEDEYRKLRVQEKVQEIEVRVAHVRADYSQQPIAREKLESIRAQIEDVKQQLKSLDVRAPCSGVVVAAERIEKPPQDAANKQLERWHGTPLDPRNLDSYLLEGTHLLSIAPGDGLDAVLLIDQGDRNDMYPGQSDELKFEHLPDRTYTGTVEKISPSDLLFAPAALSNKSGGALPTVTDAQGRERLTSIAYQATVHLEEDAQWLIPGMKGWARCVVDRRTAGEWIWRYLRRTFHFRL